MCHTLNTPGIVEQYGHSTMAAAEVTCQDCHELVLLVAGLIAFRRRHLASWLATLVFLVSLVVGVLGAYFHIVRGSLPSAPVGQQIADLTSQSVIIPERFLRGAPFMSPLLYANMGLLGWLVLLDPLEE
jgi:hypothetical protein